MLKDIEIEKIKIQNRYRKDLGNVDSLARSVSDIGLLHPVVLNNDLRLIAGLRRIEAFKRLGRDEIPAHIIDLDDILRGENDENKVRKDFTPSEAVAIGKALEPREKKEAGERQSLAGPAEGKGKKTGSGNLPEAVIGQSRDKVAAAVGMSGRSYEKAKAVVEAAEAEPEKYAPLVERMDKTGKVNPVYRKLKLEQRKQEVNKKKSETCSMVDLNQLVDEGKKFGTIYADPPWAYSNQATRAATDNHYKTMSIKDIAALPIKKLTKKEAHLHLWVTNSFLFEAPKIIEAWGFEYKSCFVWVKKKMGIGNYWRVSHEFLLLGVKGGLTFLDQSQISWQMMNSDSHSSKPEHVRNIIEKVSPKPYLELFGRQTVNDWTVWGDEIKTLL